MPLTMRNIKTLPASQADMVWIYCINIENSSKTSSSGYVRS